VTAACPQLAGGNHHICLGTNPDDDDPTTTQVRYRLAAEGVAAARSLDDIFALTRCHAPGMDYGLCNHGLYETVYSYVLHWHDGAADFYVHQGHPCDGAAFTRVPIRLGEPVDLRAYPSARSHESQAEAGAG
jgi:hypothetical protein